MAKKSGPISAFIYTTYYVKFMSGGQNSWFCKASLRIFYESFFECKGL